MREQTIPGVTMPSAFVMGDRTLAQEASSGDNGKERKKSKQNFKNTVKNETYIVNLCPVLNYTSSLKIKGIDISFLMILYYIFIV